MYTWEVEKFLQERNYQVGGDDLLKVISRDECPQFKRIRYNPFDNSYELWDDKTYIKFYAIPYEKAKTLGLVKSKKGIR
jgi:hypothetical protein